MDRELIEHVAKALYCQHNNPLDHNLTREDLNRMAEAAIQAMQSYKHSGKTHESYCGLPEYHEVQCAAVFSRDLSQTKTP